MPELADQPVGIRAPLDDRTDDLIVFIHIFKAAGTSIKAQMVQHFGVDQVHSINDGIENGRPFEDRLPEMIARQNIAAINGHFQYSRIAPILSQVTERRKRYFSIIREPLDRLVSAYNYFRMTPEEKWHLETLQMDIEQFFHFILENDPELCLNHQCRYLSETGAADFVAAAENSEKNLVFLGTLEGLSLAAPVSQAKLGFPLNDALRLNTATRVVDMADLSITAIDFLSSITIEDRKLYEFAKRSQRTH